MLWVCLVVFMLSLVLGGLYLHWAPRWGLVDVPNQRSAHQQPVPRGGGVALVLAFSVGVIWVARAGPVTDALAIWTALFLAVFAIIGVWDDRRGLGVGPRLIGYGIACVLAPLLLFPYLPLWSLALIAPAGLWLLNLYNFMDGIDGIAGSQALFVGLALAVLASLFARDSLLIAYGLLIAAASAGFLVWNWPKASMFLGDAGSVPLGFLMGLLALMALEEGWQWLAAWVVLMAAFIADASITLIWRVLTRQSFLQAHNLHAYQRLARRWGSHARVLWLLLGINLLWLMPLACACLLWPAWAPLLAAIAYLPLILGVFKAYKFP